MKKFLSIILVTLLSISYSFADVEEIEFDTRLDFSDYTGQTYLSFMQKTVFAELKRIVDEGYELKGRSAIKRAYDLVDWKIKNRVRYRWGGIDNISRISDSIEAEKVNLNNLPTYIMAVDRDIQPYDLSTFLGLASGGGVSIKYYKDNIGYNVHYDKKEKRSGRSFAVGPTRMANDVSYKVYLDDLENYITETPENTKEFFKTLLESLLNSDPSNYGSITKKGQTVLTDFLTVYTAEQARNLMDGHISLHWDAALLESTLLTAFHAGQDEITLYYFNPVTRKTEFTNETLRHAMCRLPEESATQSASLRDYWQFSRNINSEANCRRSGVNITRKEFRKLASKITKYVYKNNRELFKKVKQSIAPRRWAVFNLYKQLSQYIINKKRNGSLDADKVAEITDVWVELLEYSRTHANEITKQIKERRL